MSGSLQISGRVEVRNAEPDEIDRLAHLWHDGWQDAHAGILPRELARHRTLESFRVRLRDGLAGARVAGPIDRPVGLCMVRRDELYQLYVAAEARGSGVAAVLLADAEDRLRAHGCGSGWLACAVGNDRAARFYERSGWANVGKMINELETPDGPFHLEVWRHEKVLHEPS